MADKLNMTPKSAFALGYYYGRAFGSYDLFNIDLLTDSDRYEFKQGYDSGVTDYSILDIEEEA
jgi:hypothetical protein